MKWTFLVIVTFLISSCAYGPTTRDLAEREVKIELQFIVSKTRSPCVGCDVEINRFFNGPTIFSWGNYGLINKMKTDEMGYIHFNTKLNGNYQIFLVTEVDGERLAGIYGFDVPSNNVVDVVTVEPPLITNKDMSRLPRHISLLNKPVVELFISK
ncbi:hypothetical protein [Teredinibacter purpureus]|uniref:hypothetical protein n=1 Tax=Teredinibacter purpureus TaxID=2731756 RepID=UPI0005F83030|nr:hypothetical protein [Teredinibacter purpureus]